MVRMFLLIAGTGVLLALVAVAIYQAHPTVSSLPLPFSPVFKNFIAASGSVEAATENLSIGVPYSEIVEEVFVHSGMFVLENEPLFKLDTKVLERKLLAAKANYILAMQKYKKALAEPRAETLLIQEAIVAEQKANYEDYLKRFEIVESIKNPAAISRDEYFQRMYQSLRAGFSLTKAQAELDLLVAGSWIKDLEILQAEANLFEKEVSVIQASINAGVILAPCDGTVLQVNIHEGELAVSGSTSPLIIFGFLTPMHLRVEVDETDVWRIIPGAPGVAVMRGNSNLQFELHFVRIAPYMMPKRAITGDLSEKIDTRILPLIYSFDPRDLPIYAGLVMDVFLEARPH